MKAFQVFVLLAFGLVAILAQDLTCISPITPTLDQWCQDSCTHDPPDCPSSLCTCTTGTQPTVALSCRTLGPFSATVDDSVCQTMCTANPPFCPPNFCHCVDLNAAPLIPAPIAPHVPSCCTADPRFLFVTNNTDVLKHQIGSGPPSVCYSFPGGSPADLAVDSAGNLYIADPVSGKVYKGDVDCTQPVEVISEWPFSPIDAPTGLAISSGVLFVSGHTRVWSIIFDDSGNVFDTVMTPITILYASDITVDADGSLIFIESDASISRFDPITGVISTVLSVHQHNVPDIRGLTLNDCGLYFTATDSNQVWYCSDPTDGDSCVLYCDDSNTDALSCTFLRDPTGIASGCCCNVYVTNPGNGNVVLYRNNGTTVIPSSGEVEISNLFHPNGITIYVPEITAGCVRNEVCDITPSVTPNPTISSSVTASVSASVTIPASPSTSPSASPSPSSRVTGRLVPGVNMAAGGGAQGAMMLTGTASVSLIKCPIGATADPAECPIGADNIFSIPVSMLSLHEQIGSPPRSSPIAPYVTAVSRTSGATVAQPVCMFHTSPIINRNGVFEVCDIIDCVLTAEGKIQPSDCTENLAQIPIADAQARGRAGASIAAGSTITETDVPASAIQSATASICNGGSVAEFSVSLMSAAANQNVLVNILVQPRFDFTERCDSTLTQAPRVCIDTTLGADVPGFGVFGDEDNLVCVNEAEYVLPNGQSDVPTTFEYDSTLQIIAGDIIDQNFSVGPRAATCPFLTDADAGRRALCSTPTDRLCFNPECPP